MTSPQKETIDFSAASLEAERAEIMAHYGKAAESLAEIGKRLASLQKRLEYGEFSAFLDRLPFTHRSAYNFIRLAEHVAKYGCETVSQANVTIAAWYITPPENTELVDAIMQKAQAGEKVTKHEVKRILSSLKIEDDRLAHALHQAAEESPKLVAESLARGAMTTVQGLDLPLGELTATDVAWANEQYQWEVKQRQLLHIDENAPKEKVEVTWATIEIDGQVFLCVPPELQDRIPDSVNLWLPVVKKEAE